MPPLSSVLGIYNYQRRQLYDACKFQQKLEQGYWLLDGNNRICTWRSCCKMVISIQFFLISRETLEYRPLTTITLIGKRHNCNTDNATKSSQCIISCEMDGKHHLLIYFCFDSVSFFSTENNPLLQTSFTAYLWIKSN